MDSNLGMLVHLINFALLAAALLLLFRMIRNFGTELAWLLLAAAFLLMALTPLLDLYGHLTQQHHGMVIEFSDWLAIVSATLLLAGVFLLRRIVAERKQAQLQLLQQLDELQRFHRLAVGRELRMQALVAENATLREQAKTRGEES